jgi:hypothetical protein
LLAIEPCGCVSQIRLLDDGVAAKDRRGSVTAYLHGHGFTHSQPSQVAHSRAAKIVEQKPDEFPPTASAFAFYLRHNLLALATHELPETSPPRSSGPSPMSRSSDQQVG